MADQNTPLEHSDVVGGSTAARRVNCPRSYRLSQLVPPMASGHASREGTAMHELMSDILRNSFAPKTLLPYTHLQHAKGAEPEWSFVIDEAKWEEIGAPALNALDDFFDWLEAREEAVPEMLIEEEVKYPGIEGAFGTADIIWRCGSAAGIIDWKFGYRHVAAENNSQLLFYLRAALSSRPDLFEGVSELSVGIIQPKVDDRIDWWALPSEGTVLDDLDAALTEFDRVKDDPEAPVQEGPWCAFAPCASICPLKTGHVETLADAARRVKGLQARVETDPTHEDPAEGAAYLDLLAEAADVADKAKEWSSEIMSQVQSALEAGYEVPGFTLKEKRSPGRDWCITEAQLKHRMYNRGFKVNAYMPRRMPTVPQVEKVLKAHRLPMPEKWYRKLPPSGYTPTRVSEGHDKPVMTPPLAHQRLGWLKDRVAELTRDEGTKHEAQNTDGDET